MQTETRVNLLPDPGFGIPRECGLGDLHAREIEAEWYRRLPFSLEVTWTVRTTCPYAGGSWTIGYLLIFDREGRRSPKALRNPPTLRGPLKSPRLTSKQRAYRIAHSIPVEDDPHVGDSLTITTDLLVT